MSLSWKKNLELQNDYANSHVGSNRIPRVAYHDIHSNGGTIQDRDHRDRMYMRIVCSNAGIWNS